MIASADLMKDLAEREERAWQVLDLFVRNRDAHGVMDIGAELQALDRAMREVTKLCGKA